MDIFKFQELNLLSEKNEIDKVYFVSAYLYLEKHQTEFTLNEVSQLLISCNFAKPNLEVCTPSLFVTSTK